MAVVTEAKDTGGGNMELACQQVTEMENSLSGTSALADWNILHALQVSLKERKGRLACASLVPYEFPHFFPSLPL
jgi:hypothetical protein